MTDTNETPTVDMRDEVPPHLLASEATARAQSLTAAVGRAKLEGRLFGLRIADTIAKEAWSDREPHHLGPNIRDDLAAHIEELEQCLPETDVNAATWIGSLVRHDATGRVGVCDAVRAIGARLVVSGVWSNGEAMKANASGLTPVDAAYLESTLRRLKRAEKQRDLARKTLHEMQEKIKFAYEQTKLDRVPDGEPSGQGEDVASGDGDCG